MKSLRSFLEGTHGKVLVMILFVALLLLLTGSTVLGATTTTEKPKNLNESKITTGSGKLYKTTVERSTEGKLTDKDFHQASLLTSRVVAHLTEARQTLDVGKKDDAKAEIQKALGLIKIIRDLLPVTTVSTTVEDASGNVVYRHEEKVQEDSIPLFRGMIAVQAIEPIAVAKKRVAALKGLRLADAEIIATSVLVDLNIVERKLNAAAELLEKPDKALAQLISAQVDGIRFVTNKEDHPLVDAQVALRLAERMVEEKNYEAAEENLRVAQLHLATYRSLVGKEAGTKVKKLEEDIQAIETKLQKGDSAAKIRGFWERAVRWFKEEPGQARVTEEGSEKKQSDTKKQENKK